MIGCLIIILLIDFDLKNINKQLLYKYCSCSSWYNLDYNDKIEIDLAVVCAQTIRVFFSRTQLLECLNY